MDFRSETKKIIFLDSLLIVVFSVFVVILITKYLRSSGGSSKKAVSERGLAALPPYKQVFLVRQDLKMGKGKIAAQCAHAAVKSYKDMLTKKSSILKTWEMMGQMKIVVSVPDEPTLLEIAAKAKENGINAACIRDAGHTQVDPGSLTVCAIGPGNVNQIDAITGHLKLL